MVRRVPPDLSRTRPARSVGNRQPRRLSPPHADRRRAERASGQHGFALSRRRTFSGHGTAVPGNPRGLLPTAAPARLLGQPGQAPRQGAEAVLVRHRARRAPRRHLRRGNPARKGQGVGGLAGELGMRSSPGVRIAPGAADLPLPLAHRGRRGGGLRPGMRPHAPAARNQGRPLAQGETTPAASRPFSTAIRKRRSGSSPAAVRRPMR